MELLLLNDFNVNWFVDGMKAIDHLKTKFDINRNFPCLNKSDHSIQKTEWNNRQKERIYKIYEKDFIIFNYPK